MGEHLDSGPSFTAGAAGWKHLQAATDELISSASRNVALTAAPSLSSAQLEDLVGAIELCPDEPVPLAEVADSLATTFVAHAVDVTNPWTVAHLHCPTLTASAAVESVIGAMNQSMDTYDQSTAITLLEDRFVRWLGAEYGLGEQRSGVFTAGGTASNILAMTLARERHARRGGVDVMASGLPLDADRWRILASDQSHFSVAQAAAMMGMGRGAVIPVASDDLGALRLDALDDAVDGCSRDGLDVIAVVATAGTTDAGAIDPLAGIAERASAIGAWLHTDAAVGSALVLSDRLAPLLDGIEHSDSITTDFHKLWWQPIGASSLLVRDAASFETIREQSDYLDRDIDVEAGVLNLVGRSLDTTRRADVVKVMVGLQSVGRRRMASMLEHLVDLAQDSAAFVERTDGLELVRQPSTFMVLFRAVPTRSAASPDEVDALNVDIQRTLFDSGTAVLGRTQVYGRVALKLTLINPLASTASTRALLREVVSTANRLGE